MDWFVGCCCAEARTRVQCIAAGIKHQPDRTHANLLGTAHLFHPHTGAHAHPHCSAERCSCASKFHPQLFCVRRLPVSLPRVDRGAPVDMCMRAHECTKTQSEEECNHPHLVHCHYAYILFINDLSYHTALVQMTPPT